MIKTYIARYDNNGEPAEIEISASNRREAVEILTNFILDQGLPTYTEWNMELI